jgi:hypothetical protein
LGCSTWTQATFAARGRAALPISLTAGSIDRRWAIALTASDGQEDSEARKQKRTSRVARQTAGH